MKKPTKRVRVVSVDAEARPNGPPGSVARQAPSMSMKPGDYLYATCSAVLFARVLSIEPSATSPLGQCTIRLFAPDEFVQPFFWTTITVDIDRVFPGREPRSSAHGSWTDEPVVLATPGDGCFRCTSMFMVMDRVNLFAPCWDSYDHIAAARAEATE